MATVLIVDDDEDLRELLALIVSRTGHTTLTAATVGEAAQHLQATDVDALLLDARLGDHDGVRLCGRIRSDTTADPIAIILVSGEASSWHVSQGLAAGADDYVIKPFRRAELIARLDAALARSTRRSPAGGAAVAARAAALAAAAMCEGLDQRAARPAA
jgi:DNA-binding response OmpR family regulator